MEVWRRQAQYLSTINLSSTDRWKFSFKTHARPKGRATQVIYTEYDLPQRTRQPHDVIVDSEGMAWYASFGGHLSKLTWSIPHVVTIHSLEPLRPWKREQLGGGYELSKFCEQVPIEAADAVIAVSGGVRKDISILLGGTTEFCAFGAPNLSIQSSDFEFLGAFVIQLHK